MKTAPAVFAMLVAILATGLAGSRVLATACERRDGAAPG